MSEGKPYMQDRGALLDMHEGAPFHDKKGWSTEQPTSVGRSPGHSERRVA